jgi:hypothetical protein
MTPPKRKREGNLSVPLPFEEAVRAALEVKPPEKPPRKPRSKNPRQKKAKN